MRRVVRPLVASLITLALGVLLAAGCGLRTPDGVRVDQRSVDTAADDPDIRKLPPGPAPGAKPAEIVDGFLEAAAADPEHLIAQNFLATAAVWTNQDAVTVYDPQSLSPPTVTMNGSLSRVERSARSLGQVSSGGAFLPASTPLKVDYQLRKLDGQWRLSYVPPGVLLTPRDLARGYRPVVTYNFDASRSILVAEPGYVISDRAGLAGAALHALLTNWGGEGRTTVDPFRGLAPGLTALGSVVVRDGEATVDLGREAFNVPQADRHLLVSQIAASLGSVPGVFTVRVLVEERRYAGPPVAASIPADLAAASRGPAFGLGPQGALLALTKTSTQTTGNPVRWTEGQNGQGGQTRSGPAAQGRLIDPVATATGDRLAALRLTAGGQQLVVADLSGSSQLTAAERKTIAVKAPANTHYLAPQWLDENRLLLVSAGAGTSQVRLVDVGAGTAVTVPSPGLSELGPLTSLVISRDRTRVVAVAGPSGARRVFLGRIAQMSTGLNGNQELSVDGWAPVTTSMRDVDAVSWSGDLSITVMGHPEAPTGALGGSFTRRAAAGVALDTVADPSPLPALPADFAASIAPGFLAALPVSVTAAPDRPTLIGLGGRTWILRADRWHDESVDVTGSSAAGSTVAPTKVAVSQVAYP